MNIYSLKYKELTKELIKFNKTVYGKVMLTLAFSVPALALLLTIILLFSLTTFSCKICILILIPGLLGLFFISFIIGTYIYYKELKEFVNSKK
jgi:hypothetical protein